jgi:hypothetical protein
MAAEIDMSEYHQRESAYDDRGDDLGPLKVAEKVAQKMAIARRILSAAGTVQ